MRDAANQDLVVLDVWTVSQFPRQTRRASGAEISEAILPPPDTCVTALRLRAERQAATQDALRRLEQSLDWPTATAAPVAARRSLKADRDPQPASDLVGDTGIEPVTSSV